MNRIGAFQHAERLGLRVPRRPSRQPVPAPSAGRRRHHLFLPTQPGRLATLLDDAETRGNINADETDELDKTDLILTADGPTDYILAEISITIQQHDVDRAAHRAALLAQATGQTVTPFAFGTQEEPGINRRDVQIILIPEPTDD